MSDKPNTNSLSEMDEDDMEDLRVTLILDNNEETECRILTIFEMEGQDYIVLIPEDEIESDSDENEVFIYRYFEDENGEPSLENIEDDEEYDAVIECFEGILEEAEWDEILEDA